MDTLNTPRQVNANKSGKGWDTRMRLDNIMVWPSAGGLLSYERLGVKWRALSFCVQYVSCACFVLNEKSPSAARWAFRSTILRGSVLFYELSQLRFISQLRVVLDETFSPFQIRIAQVL